MKNQFYKNKIIINSDIKCENEDKKINDFLGKKTRNNNIYNSKEIDKDDNNSHMKHKHKHHHHHKHHHDKSKK